MLTADCSRPLSVNKGSVFQWFIVMVHCSTRYHTTVLCPQLLPFTDKLYGASNAGAMQRRECVYVKPHTHTALGVHV